MAPSELRRVGFFNVIDLNEVFAIYGLPSSYLQRRQMLSHSREGLGAMLPSKCWKRKAESSQGSTQALFG